MCIGHLMSLPLLLLATGAMLAADPAQPDNLGTVSYSAAQTRYVAVNGDDGDDGTTPATAWRSLAHAVATLQPGQLVLVGPGDYRPQVDQYKNLHVDTKGEPGAYITIRGLPGADRPRIWVDTWNGVQFWNAAYVEFDGFEVRGMDDPAVVDLQDPAHFGGGITLAGTPGCHHVRIRNCLVHHCGGNGVGAGGDQILVEGNTVRHCSHRSDAGNSGISIGGLSIGPGGRRGYGIVVRNNLCHDNVNRFGYKFYHDLITDGNGIICDYWPEDGAVDGYDRRTLIAGNICVANGGRGIHCFRYHRVDVVHNTVWRNQTHLPDFPDEGELSAVAAIDVHFANNVIVAADGHKPITIAIPPPGQPVAFSDHNILFAERSDGWSLGADDLNVDPLLLAPGATAATADWQLAARSPAIASGDGAWASVSGSDRAGRPRATVPDRGALQRAGAHRRTIRIGVRREGAVETSLEAWQGGEHRTLPAAAIHLLEELDPTRDLLVRLLIPIDS